MLFAKFYLHLPVSENYMGSSFSNDISHQAMLHLFQLWLSFLQQFFDQFWNPLKPHKKSNKPLNRTVIARAS